MRLYIVGLMAGILLLPCFTFADDTGYNLQITGTILALSCDVDTTDIQVTLDDVASDTFVNVGDTSAAKDFHIKLSNCSDGVTGAVISFTGTPDTNNPALLQLTQDPGVATGAAVEVLDDTGAAIPLGSVATQALSDQADSDLLYQVRYKSTLPTVTGGTANAVMYFDIGYQ
jgi:type 1 fimbria pilin